MTDATEVTLKQWLDSFWFRTAARGAMLLGVPLLMAVSGWIGWVMNGIEGRTFSLETDVAQVQSTLTVRAADSERFQASVSGDLLSLQSDMAEVKVDIGFIRGTLEAMSRRDTARAIVDPRDAVLFDER
jgi:hypothetical protein